MQLPRVRSYAGLGKCLDMSPALQPLNLLSLYSHAAHLQHLLCGCGKSASWLCRVCFVALPSVYVHVKPHAVQVFRNYRGYLHTKLIAEG